MLLPVLTQYISLIHKEVGAVWEDSLKASLGDWSLLGGGELCSSVSGEVGLFLGSLLIFLRTLMGVRLLSSELCYVWFKAGWPGCFPAGQPQATAITSQGMTVDQGG